MNSKILLNKLEWKNWLSYGSEESSIDFTTNKVSQLLGDNMAGKSTVATILEEVLFGKNSRGIAKVDLINRNATNAYAVLYISVNDINYVISYNRSKSKLILLLIKEDDNISKHSSKDTYKLIESILGLEFKTFSSLTYQSSTSSLEFLTASDSIKKDYLMNLLDLTIYKDLGSEVAIEFSKAEKELANLEGRLLGTVAEIIIPEVIETKQEPQKPVEPSCGDEYNRLFIENKLIEENNRLKASIKEVSKPDRPTELVYPLNNTLVDLTTEVNGYVKLKNTLLKAGKTCPTCKQVVNNNFDKTIEDLDTNIEKLYKKIAPIKSKLSFIQHMWSEYKRDTEEYNKYTEIQEKLKNNLPEELHNLTEFEESLALYKVQYNSYLKLREQVNVHNYKAEVSNKNREDLIKKKEISNRLQQELKNKINILKLKLDNLRILKNVFSTNGIIGYKIEGLMKVSEGVINEYLTFLTKGRFQLQFNLTKAKLVVNVVDNGKTISLSNLSAGELGRCNIATLLGIRVLLSNLSNITINFLFLDEVFGILDAEGCDTVIDLLLEENINTLFVAHEYTHPLVDKIQVTKIEGISRLEQTS